MSYHEGWSKRGANWKTPPLYPLSLTRFFAVRAVERYPLTSTLCPVPNILIWERSGLIISAAEPAILKFVESIGK